MPQGEFTGMLLIAAQDLFFAAKPFADAMEMETCLVIQFTPQGSVRYVTDRPPS